MSLDQRIEDGLRQRPSDERVYSESLRRLVSLRGVEPVIGGRTGRSTLRRSAVPALGAFCMLLVLAAAALFIGAVGPWRATNMGGSPQASGSPLASGSPQASGSLRASGAPEASTTPAVSTSSPLVSPIQLSASVPSVALTGQIACWGRAPGFTEAEMAAAFASPSANVDTVSTAAGAAMRSMLATLASQALPKTGWVVVSESSTQATFLTISPTDYQLWGATFTLDTPTAGWRSTFWGRCNAMAMPPDGYERATWSLDPSAPPTPSTTDLHILVAFGSCHDQPISGGPIAVNATQSGATVTVTAFGRSPVGAQTCSDTPPVPAIVHLQQPFGNLTLLDGGRYPAVQVAANGQPTATSSPAAQVTAAPSPGPTYLVYVVRPGDTLSAIAARFNVTLWEIELANPRLTNPNHVEVGQSLNLPPPGLLTQPPASPSGG